MSARMRLVGWEVRPIVMADDGENLAPINIAPRVIPAAAWQAFKDGGDTEALCQLRAQVESSGLAPSEAVQGAPVEASAEAP